ncbi:D-apionate lactonase [Ensifer soli]|uniref:D-apionate lactonase n=1 Tax=Ciceribacter sp. sgz301302 TaxID=3342379 RepID=UPI0035BB7BFE
MSALGPEDAFRLYGTPRTETPPVRLTAGRLSVDLAGGNLRTLRYDGVEVLRAVSYLVRDRDWGTYDPVIADLRIDEAGERFSVSYTAACQGPDGTTLAVTARILGEKGRLTFAAEALTPTGFETNRCGFCILHPIVGVAGTPVRVEHVDGSIVETALPDTIDPWQPFKDMRAITHTALPGVTVACRMEGDTFEMEDQRNWSDASYKTYVRPLALPWPYRIEAGAPVRQVITLTISDARSETAVATGVGDVVTLTPGSDEGTLPAIGLVVTPEDAKAVLAARDTLSAIGAQELLFHFDPTAGHGADALADFAAILEGHSGTSTLEIAVACKGDLGEELSGIAALAREAGFRPDAVVVVPSVDRQSTPPGSVWPDCPPLDDLYRAARKAFPDVRLGGGMLSYFTELNRKRVPAEALDVITHCTNPIVHAADDLSVMQTLEALPFITRSVRAIYGDMPYRIGPSTIAMRQNPYGSRTMDNPQGVRMAMANRDPRHNGAFGAAFALGYAIAVAPAALETLCLSALTGPFGLIAGEGEPSAAGTLRPLGTVVARLAALGGSRWQAALSSAPSRVLAMTITTDKGERVLAAVNLTADTVAVDLSALGGERLVLGPYAADIITFP